MATCVSPASWDYYSSGGILGTFGTPGVKDPVQGVFLKNCSLIAAFASLAWKGKISTQPPGPKITYTFQFYPAERPQKTDGILPLDSVGNLMHAKSDTPTEIWPALYEKAYYQWLDKLGLDNASGRPDYCSHIEWQNPVTVLSQLTGLAVSQKSCQSAADTVFSDINNWCQGYGPIATNRTITTPAVAWTYDPKAPIPTGAVYSDTTIAAQHTYSLLGVTGTKSGTEWTSKYIVLRNPYGKGKGDPNMTGSLYNGVWCNINLGDIDGIFALQIDQFVKYFAGYAWTIV
jgi:hypothetical protein